MHMRAPAPKGMKASGVRAPPSQRSGSKASGRGQKRALRWMRKIFTLTFSPGAAAKPPTVAGEVACRGSSHAGG